MHKAPDIRELDPINFWEPFNREIPRMRVGLAEIIKSIRQKTTDSGHLIEDYYRNTKIKYPHPILFSFNTINQREALKPLYNYYRGISDLLTENQDFGEVLPKGYTDALALKYKWNLIWWYFILKGRSREIYRSRFYNYYLRLGQYLHLSNVFSNSKIRYYIASNDHSGLSQVGFVAARNHGIKSIYVQHASVSDKFPPLKTDYALLEGEDSLNKYANKGIKNTQIYLIGGMKYDAALQSPLLNSKDGIIGICLGHIMHNYQLNFELCKLLAKKEIPFCLRFHPAVGKSTIAPFEKEGWEISDHLQEDALSFILRCNTIVSGDSNILLEGIILKRKILYFASDGIGSDYYGFVKQGIAGPPLFMPNDVLDALDADFDIEHHRTRAKFFNSVLYTSDEGRSTELAINLLDSIMKDAL